MTNHTPSPWQPPISLVLDLDETLLHSSITPLAVYDIVFPVHFNGVNYQLYVRKRPHMDEFLEKVLVSPTPAPFPTPIPRLLTLRHPPPTSAAGVQVSEMFEIIVFTASQKVYADRLLSIIDPQRKWIKHRVFRSLA